MNQVFSLDIAISVDPDTPVSASVLYLTFDPDILYFMSAIEGDFFANNVTCSEPPCDSSTYFDVYSDLNSGAIGDGTFATLNFKAIGLGTSSISFIVDGICEVTATCLLSGSDLNEITDVVKTSGRLMLYQNLQP